MRARAQQMDELLARRCDRDRNATANMTGMKVYEGFAG